MKDYLPKVDEQKLKAVLRIKEEYNDGKISLEEGKALLKKEVGVLHPYEIALAEQELKEYNDEECRKENIQSMLDLFADIMDTSRPDLPEDHPIARYYQENDAIRKCLLEIEDLVQYPVIKNQWLELYDRLLQFRIHLSRKQNQLYPLLEKKGFDRPTKTMWLLDDFVRNEIRDAYKLLEEDKDDQFIAMQQTIVDDVRDLLSKEETVLYPTSLAMISPEEFEDMKSGDREIGFALIDVNPTDKAADTAKPQSPATEQGFAADLANLLSKYGYHTGGSKQVLDVATGKLTLDQINLIYKHMPVDISYVDENELVCFYTDTDHRVFPRSKNVIGRDVKNCHPRTSVHLVEEIIEKFRSGEQDSVDFWINKPGVFIYIYYVAVRDENGKFRGVLEMMQDCTRIRSLEGSRTLLTWSNDTKPASAHTEEKQTVPPETRHSPEAETPSHSTSPIEITEDTRLKDLLEAYPQLKTELPKINSAFKMLNSPLARVMIPKATVGMMSKRSGMELDTLIAQLKRLTGL